MHAYSPSPALAENWDLAPDREAIRKECLAFDKGLPDIVEECETCQERWFDMRLGPTSECTRCSRDETKRFGGENNMIPDPPGTHPLLEGLTPLEELLISPIVAVASVYRLAGGQYGYRNHVLAFPMDIQQTVDQLPRRTGDLPLLVVQIPGRSGPPKEFVVRRHVVFDALRYLCNIRHPGFEDVRIADLNEAERASDLPENGVPKDLPVRVLHMDHRQRLCLTFEIFDEWLATGQKLAERLLTLLKDEAPDADPGAATNRIFRKLCRLTRAPGPAQE